MTASDAARRDPGPGYRPRADLAFAHRAAGAHRSRLRGARAPARLARVARGALAVAAATSAASAAAKAACRAGLAAAGCAAAAEGARAAWRAALLARQVQPRARARSLGGARRAVAPAQRVARERWKDSAQA